MADNEAGPAPASTPASTPAPAIAAPPSVSTTPTPAAGSDGVSGEPPRERWADILNNARAKTRAEVEAVYQERYGAFEQDPWHAIEGWLAQASQHSLYGPLIRQHYEQQAKGRRQEPGEEPMADVPIVDAQGQVTGHTYSDKALKAWHRWNQAQHEAALEERFGRVESSLAQRDERDLIQHTTTQANQQAATTLGELRQKPYFKEHEAKIRAAFVEHPEWGDNIHAAYNHVLITDILPTLSQAEQQRTVDQLTNKTTAVTVPPHGTAPAAPRFKSFRAAAEYYAQHPDEAAAMANR